MTFKQNHPLLLAFLQICFLRQGPQILPASRYLFGLLVALNVIIGTVELVFEFSLLAAILLTVTHIGISLGLVYLILLASMKAGRTLQTLTALSGTAVILNAVSLPLIGLLPEEGQQQNIFTMLLAGIFFWNIFIIGGIFRHALSISLAMGVFTSIGYIFITLVILYPFFPAV